MRLAYDSFATQKKQSILSPEERAAAGGSAAIGTNKRFPNAKPSALKNTTLSKGQATYSTPAWADFHHNHSLDAHHKQPKHTHVCMYALAPHCPKFHQTKAACSVFSSLADGRHWRSRSCLLQERKQQREGNALYKCAGVAQTLPAGYTQDRPTFR